MQLRLVFLDDNFNIILSTERWLELEASNDQKDFLNPGTITIRLPIDFQVQLTNLGILLDPGQQPRRLPDRLVYVMARPKTNPNWHIVGNDVFFLTRAVRVWDDTGECTIELEGTSQELLLSYRVFPRNSDDAALQFNDFTTTVMQALVNQAFTDAFGVNAARDWIAAGTIANNITPGQGPNNWQPDLSFRTLAEVFQDAVDYAREQGAPVFFRIAPTINAIAGGTQPALPFVITSSITQPGVDRSATVNLSIEGGNLRSLIAGVQWDPDVDRSVMYGAGNGTGAAQVVTAAPSINNDRVASSRFGWAEAVFTDSQVDNAARLLERQRSALEQAITRSVIEPGIADTERVIFGTTYNVGDRVTITYVTSKGDTIPRVSITAIIRSYDISSVSEHDINYDIALEPDQLPVTLN